MEKYKIFLKYKSGLLLIFEVAGEILKAAGKNRSIGSIALFVYPSSWGSTLAPGPIDSPGSIDSPEK